MNRVKHGKRGPIYRVVSKRATLQTSKRLEDNDAMVIYVHESTGSCYVRPLSEFLDGRFIEAADDEGIVSRLRNASRAIRGGWGQLLDVNAPKVLDMAADEIVKLQARIKKLEQACPDTQKAFE